MTKFTQAILIFLIPPIFRLLAMKRIRMYMPFVCGSRWQWYFSFCSLEPKWTRRTLSFCPLGSLSPSSALHLDTLVWVEVLSQISHFWTIFATVLSRGWVFRTLWMLSFFGCEKNLVIFLLLVWHINGFNPL